MKQPLVQLKHVTIAYDPLRPVFENADLTIYEHEFLGITGPNGGGKTTLVKTILGLEKVVKGELSFFKAGKQVKSLEIGYLPQRNKIDAQFPVSVYEVVLSGLAGQKKIWQRFSKEQHERVREMIEEVGLSGFEQQPIGMLSGGQQQRAFFARAVIANPDLLILDEPNTYVDQTFEHRLYELLEEISRHSTVLLVSHNLAEVVQYARDYIFVSHCIEACPENEDSRKWLEARM